MTSRRLLWLTIRGAVVGMVLAMLSPSGIDRVDAEWACECRPSSSGGSAKCLSEGGASCVAGSGGCVVICQ